MAQVTGTLLSAYFSCKVLSKILSNCSIDVAVDINNFKSNTINIKRDKIIVKKREVKNKEEKDHFLIHYFIILIYN